MKNQYLLILLFLGAGHFISAQTYDYIIEATSISWTGDYDFFNDEYAATISGACDGTTQATGGSSASASPMVQVGSGSGIPGNTVSITFGYEGWENDDSSGDLCFNDDDNCPSIFCDEDNSICSGTFSGAIVLPPGLTDGATIALPATGGSNTCSGNGGTFTLNTVQVRIITALPVHLLSFEGEAQQEGVVLHWKTENEINNDYMAIERSQDGEKFVTIGEVSGYGTTNQIRSYKFVDEVPFQAENYYRLRQIDFDGTITYHKIIMVNYAYTTSITPSLELRVFPNPASSEITAVWSGLNDPNTAIFIYDLSGRRVLTFETDGQNLAMPIGDLLPGLYILQLHQNGNMQAVKFQKN